MTTATMTTTTADAVMTLIQRCEVSLRQLGLEADTWPLQIGDVWPSLTKRETWRDHAGTVRGTVCIELGFAKVGGAWRIATRRALYDDRDHSAPVRTDALVPLVCDSPARRAAAVEHLADLVGEVALARVEEVQAIERACLDLMPYR